MKSSLKIKLLGVVLLTASYAVAQNNTPQYFLNQLPALPGNFCSANHDEIERWNDRITLLKDKMMELHVAEKYAKEEYQATVKPNLALYEPSNEAVRERFKTIMDEIQSVSDKSTMLLTDFMNKNVEKKGEILVKYRQMREPLYEQRDEVIRQGKSTSAIDMKVYNLNMQECKEMAVVRREFLSKYRESLDKLVEYGIRANTLQDESYGIIYESYTYKTRYGFWLEYIMPYVDELMNIYDDIPMKNTDRENI